MSTGSQAERSPGDSQPIRPITVGEFLGSLDLNSVVRRYQEHEAESELNMPLDYALAEMLVYVGRNHIRHVYDSLCDPTRNITRDPALPEALTESVTAVVFGLSYLALREFATVTPLDQDGQHMFDNARLLARLDAEMDGTPLTRKTAISTGHPQPLERELVDAANWNNIVDVARGFDFAALLNGRGWVKLPSVITQLIGGFDREKEVPQMVERFQGVLMRIETKDEKDARLQSILPRIAEPEDSLIATDAQPTRRDAPAGSQALDIFQLIGSDPHLMRQIENL